jgi:hypothetical protein
MTNKLTDEQFYAQMDKIKQLGGFNPFEGFADELYKQVGNQNPVSAFINTFSPEARAQIMQPMEQQVQQMPEVPYTNDGTFQSLAGSSQTGGHDIYSGSDPTDYGVAGGEQVSNSDKWIAENAVAATNILAQPENLVSGLLDIGSGYYQKATGDTTNQEQVDLANNTTQQFQEMFTPEGLHKGPDALGLAAGGTYLAGKAGGWAGNKLASSGINDKIDAVVNDNPGLFPTELGGQSKAVPGGIHPETKIDNAGFYSEAENVINKLPQETNLPDDVQRFMKKNGIDKEEFKELGLSNYFKQKNDVGDRVTRTGLLAHIREEKPTQEDVVLKGGTEDNRWDELYDDNNWEIDEGDFQSDYIDRFVDHQAYELDSDSSGHEYFNHIESGLKKLDPEIYKFDNPQYKKEFWDAIEEKGYSKAPQAIKTDIEMILGDIALENYQYEPVEYKEISIDGEDIIVYHDNVEGTYFARPRHDDSWQGELIARDNEVYSIEEAVVRLQETYGDFADGETMWSSNTQPGMDMDTYEEHYITSDMIKKYGGFSHTHHGDTEDVGMHLRTSVRQDDGGEVLFIEELQSDIHQKAREKTEDPETGKKVAIGYKGDEDSIKLQAESESITKTMDNLYKEHSPISQKTQQKIANEHDVLMKAFKDGTIDYSMINDRIYIDGFSAGTAMRSVIDEIQENVTQLARYEQIIANQDSAYDLNSVESKIPQIKDRLDNLEKSQSVQLQDVAKSIAREKHPDIFKKLDDVNKKLRKLKDKSLKNERKLDNKQPSAPLKDDKWIDAGIEKAIQIAKEKGINRVAWTNSDQQVRNWNENYRDLYETLYDKKMRGASNRIANKYGSQTGDMNLWLDYDHGEEPVQYISINDRMKEEMTGISSFGGTSAPKPNQDPNHGSMKTEARRQADKQKKVTDGLLKQEPLTVYRSSTSGSYDKFDKSKQKSALLGQGVYMFDNEKSANDWVGGNLQKIELPYDYMEKSINWGDGGQSDFVTKAFKKIEKEVDFKLDLEDGGIDVYPELVKKLGENKAQALLSKHGIYGNRRDYGNKKDQELTIFNVDDAKIISTDKKKPKNGLLD